MKLVINMVPNYDSEDAPGAGLHEWCSRLATIDGVERQLDSCRVYGTGTTFRDNNVLNGHVFYD